MSGTHHPDDIPGPFPTISPARRSNRVRWSDSLSDPCDGSLLCRLTFFLSSLSPSWQGLIAGLCFLVISIGCAWTCYATARDAFQRSVNTNLLSIARIAKQQIDPRVHATLIHPEQHKSPEYLALVKPLRAMVTSAQDVRSIYTMRPSPEGFRFVLDSGDPQVRNPNGLPDQATLGTLYPEAPPDLLQRIQAYDCYVSPEPRSDPWGTFISVWIPIRNQGRLEAVLGVDMDIQELRAQSAAIWNAQLIACIMATIASVLIGVWVYLYVKTKRTYVDQLAQSEHRYALAVDGSNEGIWDWDLRSDSIYLSEQLRWMIGAERNQAIVTSVRERFRQGIHPDDLARVEEATDKHLRDRVPYDIEFRLWTASGSYRWFRSRGQAVWDDHGTPIRFAGSIGDVHDRVRLQRQLHRAARRDRLTRLPNRSALLSQVRKVIQTHQERPDHHYALLFLDFDRFKIVNDSLGHEVGDALLKAIAARLRENLRDTDGVLRASCSSSTAARIGGDEFVVLLEGLQHPDDAILVARRLLKALAKPYTIKSYRVLSTASIGIVLGDDQYQAAEDLLRDADTAMYEAKTSCRGSLAVFDETMRRRVKRRMQLEQGLREAIPADQLDLVYQPIVCLQTGRVLSFEVLSRWEHPELGPISPKEFIPMAEECGLIVAMGERMIERSFRQLARWRMENPDLSIPGVSVNLARQHLLVPDLVCRLLNTTKAAGLLPSDIHIEITEGAVMHDLQAARSTLNELRAAGFSLAIDDFGTGYSSLACLHEFPFDLLKIDQSFIRDLGISARQTAIVRTVTSLAETLGFRVVAEGIETADQLAMLQQFGCDCGQGYFFARPTPAETLPLRDCLSLEGIDQPETILS
ncbi:putative bifunctional diguanylate cyclase/phosphodiesterase [Tautonia marina]|uniref:putative bifunctional diguanylate cyclase/phosphodiesterase n=1 Tax=Tautonia marina TaxID=2653855 RepID=UPI001375D08F|nr:GGDEF domain-containing phosphodiesterase [Tautonia marina]